MGGRLPTPGPPPVRQTTETQSKKSKYRLAFSPMTPIKGGYKGYYCFENYWQSGKVIEGMDFVDKIKRGDENNNGSVEDPDKIISFKSQ